MGSIKTSPEFVLFTGPMFGGKTSRMLAALDRAKYQSKKIAAYKPKMDHRYLVDSIVTHAGYKWEARCVSSGDDILESSRGCDIIAVDEAFMIDGVSDVLIDLFMKGKTIFASTIQLSARGETFSEVQKMFPWATRIEVCPAVCPECGTDAFYTVPKVEGLSQIDVGGSEKYEPRCHDHTGFLR
jgi:thymidine kinase